MAVNDEKVAHVVAAAYQTVTLGKLVPSKKEPITAYPFGRAKLALTGIFITWCVQCERMY
jgi:hypothetical protein